MIETQNLTRKFGDLTAVDNLTLRVDKGEVFGFLGPNGAGKTTTVRMLCCLISRQAAKPRIGDYEVGNPEDASEDPQDHWACPRQRRALRVTYRL